MIQKLRPLVFIRGSGVSALCKMMQQNMFMHLLENSVETLMQQQITAEKKKISQTLSFEPCS